MTPIRVVVADDSPFVCRLLASYLESDPGIRVVGTALNGKEAVEMAANLRPDAMTLDLNMPQMGGLEALRHIMSETPTAVVLISGVSREAVGMTNLGMSMGAVDFICKYAPGGKIPPEALKKEIVSKVKAAGRIKVIRSIPSMDARYGKNRSIRFSLGKNIGGSVFSGKAVEPDGKIPGNTRLVVIGASTGGPLALKELLGSLTPGFPFCIVVVQHMPEGFTRILAEQFDRLFPFEVKEAGEGDSLDSGKVFIAPGNRHLIVTHEETVSLTQGPEINGHRPSIDVTMQSAAQVYTNSATGVILSGMGADGTQGMTAIRNNRGHTFAQSKETCVIDSMPSSALGKGVIEWVGGPVDIGRWLSGEKIAIRDVNG